MALDTMDKLVAALSGGQKRDFYKASATAEGAGTWHSLWAVAGQPPAGAAAGSLAGEVPTSAITGSFKFTNNLDSHLVQAIVSGATVGKWIIYDRLWHNSTMSGIVTTDTSLGAVPDLTRPDALGAGTELWGEIYTAIGATAATLNVKYTNQDGTTVRNATYSHPANAESVGQMFPIILQAGDTGVRKATSYNWSVSTGTAGNFGLTIMRRIAEIPISQVNVGMVLDFALMGMPRIYDSACLAMMVLCSTTATGVVQGNIIIGQG